MLLEAAAVFLFASAGEFNSQQKFSADTVLQFSQTTELTVINQGASGNLGVSFAATGEITVIHQRVSGSLLLGFASSGNLFVVNNTVAGSVNISFGATGDLTVKETLTGLVHTAFSSSADLSISREIEIEASGALVEFTPLASIEISGQYVSGDAALHFSASANDFEISGQHVSGDAAWHFSTSGVLQVKNNILQGNSGFDFTNDSALTVGIILTGQTGFASSGLVQMWIDMPLEATRELVFKQKAELDQGRESMGACDVVRHVMLLWGIENSCDAPKFVQEAALDVLNGVMQIVWNQAKDRNYWTRLTQSITLPANTSSYALDNSIQNVIGPVRRADNKRPLVLVNTRAEIDQFEVLFLDETSSGMPVGYHIERIGQSGEDPAGCVFHVAPTPAEETSFLMDVVLEAPRFSWTDVSICSRVPMPHRYVESLLLPVARYHAMSSHLFIFPERAQQIASDYEQASALLETADPLPAKT